MAWNDDLQVGTPAYGIAASNHNRIRVLAGPGTGKSFAMKRRVARLLEVDQVEPKKILAVTFTRVAAEDLHRELVSLGVNGANHLNGKTLHSLAMAILMRNHVLPVLGRTPRPLNKFELEPLLSDLNPNHGDKHKRKRLIRAYGAAWAQLQTQEPGYARCAEEQAFVDDLLSWLQFHQAMLIDEIIPQLYEYLRANPGAPEHGEYDHVLVDEYQDLNRAEQDVLKFLGTQGSMCVIGDDDQSIYSFKYAHPEGIRQWANPEPTDHHQITECRRCPITVARMANALIAHNVGRIAGRVMVERPQNGFGTVVIRQYNTVEEEANAVATKIAALIQAGVAPNEIVVLAQRDTFAAPIFNRLREQNIPTKSYYAETELDTTEAQERFAMLKLLLNNEDRVALRWLLGRGNATWHKNAYKRIMDYVTANGTSPWQVLNALASGALNLPYTGNLVARFQEIQAELTALQAVPDLDQFIGLWLPQSDHTTLLNETVLRCRETATTPEELYDSLYDAITQPEVPLQVGEVRIMSLHKSKGLSSPFVFIVGCVEGLMPSSANPETTLAEQRAKLEEDRRLFYVGITRVKAELPNRDGYLSLTYSQTMDSGQAYANQITAAQNIGGMAILQPSRFIGEMAPHAPASLFNAPL